MPGAQDTRIQDERAPAVAQSGRDFRTDAAALVGLTVLSIGLPLLVAWAGGALGIPRNDDFSYEGILFHWSKTGTLRFDNWPAMTLVGQLAMARPLVEIVGPRVTALQLLTTFVGAVGVCATYFLLCRVTMRRIAVAAVLTTALGPLWAPLAASFMTDLWAYSAMVLCLLVGCVGLSSTGGRRMSLLTLSVAIGLIAVSIRESGIVAPVAVLGVASWLLSTSRRGGGRSAMSSWRKGDGLILALIVAFLVVVVGILLAWRSSIPFGGQSSLKSVRETLEDPGRIDIWGTAIEPAFKALFTLGLLTLPAAALVSVRGLIRRIGHPRPSVAIVAGAFAVVAAILAWRSGPVGNYVMRELGPSLSLGAPDDRFPKVAWTAIAALSAYSCFVLVLCVVGVLVHPAGDDSERTRRTPARIVVTTFSLLSIGLMIVSGPFDQPIYDRHLLPLVPFVAAFVMIEGGLRPIARQKFVFAASSSLVAFAVLGLVFSTSAAVYDGTRWRAASDLVASGLEPMRIDGGLDWVGFHSGEPQRSRDATTPQDTWWASSYDDFQPCVLIVSGTWPLGDQYRRTPVRTWVTTLPFGGEMTLRAFERTDCTDANMLRNR
jgi:hypothetical protein